MVVGQLRDIPPPVELHQSTANTPWISLGKVSMYSYHGALIVDRGMLIPINWILLQIMLTAMTTVQDQSAAQAVNQPATNGPTKRHCYSQTAAPCNGATTWGVAMNSTFPSPLDNNNYNKSQDLTRKLNRIARKRRICPDPRREHHPLRYHHRTSRNSRTLLRTSPRPYGPARIAHLRPRPRRSHQIHHLRRPTHRH